MVMILCNGDVVSGDDGGGGYVAGGGCVNLGGDDCSRQWPALFQSCVRWRHAQQSTSW
jgi:hypothetical protein